MRSALKKISFSRTAAVTADSAGHAETTASINHGESARTNPDMASQLVSIGRSGVAMRVMIHTGQISDKQPLIILNSVDYPMPPSQSFCETMWEAGLQVVFIERPGFGSARGLPKAVLQDALVKSGAAVTAEAALLHQWISQLELEDGILLGMGSANPVCYRLSRLSQRISLAVFSNPMFNQNIWDVFRPEWFQKMLRQTIESKAGLQFATYGIKYKLRREPFTFYRQLLQKSPGDLNYFEQNRSDFLIASRMIRQIEVDTFNYDLKMSLSHDDQLHDDFFSGVNALIISGTETTPLWKNQLELEADRLGLAIEYLPNGDLYAPYASPGRFLDALKPRLAKRSQSASA